MKTSTNEEKTAGIRLKVGMKSKNYSPLLSALLFEVALGMELNQKLFYPKVTVQPVVRWGALWRSENNLDGIRKHLCYENGVPALFITRRQCRDWIKLKYGYIKERDDLREEPHGWRMPLPVKVTITPNERIYW